uniref:Uncharacterized protein n=1 Tax=Avena sativa TaxID=4498 RepID=A0ACD5Z137_AVESA
MVIVGEVAIGVTVLGYFVSPHISKLMEVARSCAYSKYYELHRGKVKKLLELAKELDGIKSCFLRPAVMGGFVQDPARLTSLWQLKDAIHDAEEILDLFESHILELEAAKNLKKHSGGASKAPLLDQQLNAVLKNLVGLREKAQDLIAVPSPINEVHSGRSAGTGQDPVRDKKLFFGYGAEYEQLVSMLRDGGNTEKKVIAIIGHGGMGKTELARQAFRDVKGDFHRLVWVPAYHKKTEFDLLAEIWKSAVGAKSVDEMNICSLQTELKKLLSSDKCLLVLDDVWNDECAVGELERKFAWNGLRSLLGDGSRIVMTTRAKICSTTLDAEESIVLNGINSEDIKLLLNHTAKLMTDGSQRRVEDIKLLLKFKGSPLAALEIGEELKKQTTTDGRREILNTIDQHMVSVFKGHLFTYHHLPPHLQRCFSFCSIFPDNWRFEPEKLTKMWMALGFVEENANHPLAGTSSMEDVARGYFNSLVDRSLFHLQQGEGVRKEDQHYVIHEQIHWMLRLASARNCISISSDSAKIPATVRHMSVTSGYLDQLKARSIGLGNLRTLLVLKDDGTGSDPAPSIDKDILKEFKGVRVLDLTETGITQLPKNIKKLKHVRYLGLPSTISSDLCAEVTRLLFLQTLSVGHKSDTKKKIGCIASISGIGRLSKLRESIEFQVIRGSEKEGHSVSELAGMNSLGEMLSIKGLDAVASKKEAEEAKLGTKISVKILKLEWGPPNLRQVDYIPAAGSSSAAAAAAAAVDPAAAVLEGLKPHRCLHELRITRYPGETSPTSAWFSGLEKLTRLYLKNCRKLKALPALGGLPSLEILDIKELTSIERINHDFCGGGAFPKLKKILLEDMRVLVAWDDMPRDAFPLLSDVSIVDCPELSSLSGLGCCGGPIRLRVRGCARITPGTLPAKFRDGVSTCKFPN